MFDRIETLKMEWGVFKIMMALKRQLLTKFNQPTIEARNHLRIQHGIAGYSQLYYFISHRRAQKDLLAFLRATSWRDRVCMCIDAFCKEIRFIQVKMRNQMMYNKARLDVLRKHWEKEI